MFYQFRCPDCGIEFEVNQPMLSEHKANCLQCGAECQRMYSPIQVMWAGSAFRKDGSYREQNDYAVLKG